MKRLLAFLFLLSYVSAYAQTDTKSAVDKLAQQYVSSANGRGLIIGVINHEKQQVFSYGEADKGSKQSPAANSIFEIGELSGLFTTTILARMAITGEVDLDMPVQSLMPQGQRLPLYPVLNCEPVGLGMYACDPYTGNETLSLLLCNLASHNAGFPRNPSSYKKWFHPKNPYATYSKKDLYAYLSNHPAIFTYGFEYKYSNIGLALLGDLLAIKTDTSYAGLLTQRLLVPLSLQNTSTTLSAEQQIRFLQGHNRKGKATSQWNFDVLAPAIGLRSSMDDLMKFLSVNMGLSDSTWIPTVKLAQTPRNMITAKPNNGDQVGLGWIISPMANVQDAIIWHSGKTGGFASFIGFTKNSGIGIVILSNSAIPVTNMGKMLLQHLNNPTREPNTDNTDPLLFLHE